jgi:hypothetical protein
MGWKYKANLYLLAFRKWTKSMIDK